MSSPPPTDSSASQPPRLAPRVVIAVWAVSTAAAFWFVGTDVSDVPWGDEFDIVPIVTGDRPFSLQWLWEPHNEHRIPLPRLIRYGVLVLTGTDFRAAPYLITAMLSGLGLATAVGAARVRGRFAITDAFFPLVWLHWGQVENIIWGFQIQFALSVLLTTIVLLVVLTRSRVLSLRPVVLAGGCTLLLPLCGTNGAVTAAPLAAWLGYVGASGWVRGRARVVAAVLSLASFALIAVYFMVLPRGKPLPEEVTLWNQAEAALACLSTTFGLALESNWPLGGYAMLSLLAATAAVAGRAGWRYRHERPRAFGLVAVVASAVLLAAAIGHGRAVAGADGGLQSRYSTLLIPALCAIYFAAEIYPSERTARRIQVALLVVAVAIQANVENGKLYAENYALRRANFCRDLDAGWPSAVLAIEYYHHPFGLLYDPEVLDEQFRLLHNSGVGRFARMRLDPCNTETQASENGATLPHAYGLESERRVYAIVVHWTLEGASVPQEVVVSWRNRKRIQPSGHSTAILFNQLTQSVIWVGDEIDEFRFIADPRSGRLKIFRVMLMVPPAPPAAKP
jgi:hypothetical protein